MGMGILRWILRIYKKCGIRNSKFEMMGAVHGIIINDVNNKVLS